MHSRTLSLLLFPALLPLMGISQSAPAPAFTAALSPVAAQADNALAFDLLREVASTEGGGAAAGGNIVFSPFSVWTALAMTSAGAEKTTLEEMRTVLRLPLDDAAAHALAGGWARELGALQDVECAVANCLWGAQGLPFGAGFLKLTEAEYNAGLETLDFKSDADKARRRINDWVAQQTRDRIKDLLGPGHVLPDTRLVLTNAVYFKAKWISPFPSHATRDHGFTLLSGENVMVKKMSDSLRVPYMENRKLQAVRLPYRGGQTSMIVVLPRQASALKDPAFLGAAGFAEIQKELKPGPEVIVRLPRFEASARLSLPKVLQKLGMKKAFTDNAEFGRMCPEPLKVSEVVHQAWVKVAEEGTEAAAATGVVMMPAGAAMKREEPKIFSVDHPFLFFIVDDRNSGILFAGAVMDPRK